MTEIRDFESYEDAEAAVREAGFTFVEHSGSNSWAPTLTYHHPETGETVEVLWASNRGYIRRQS